MISLRIIGVIIIWSFAVSLGMATDLQSVLDKNLQSLGGREAIAAQKSVEAFSTVEYMGLTGHTVTIVKFPDQYYTFMDLGGMKQTDGFDGLTAWTTDPNGITRKDIGEEQKPMLNELYLSGYSYLLPGRNPGRNEYRGDTLIDGQSYHKVVMFPVGGDSLFVFFNADNGRLEYRRERITGLSMITTYSDFRKIDGVEMPFGMKVITPGAPYEIAGWVDSIRVNSDIPDSLFLMPGVSTVDYEFPSGNDSVTVDFDIGRFGIFVAVRVNGQGPFRFLLDSGAATTILSKTLAEKLNLSTIGDLPARGVGGFGSLGLGAIDSVNIGSLSWHLDRVTIFDFAPLTGGLKTQIDGILGYDFFVRFPMLIDFDNNRMTLYNPASFTAPNYENTVNFELYCQIPVVDVTLDGGPVRMALDLGAQAGLLLQAHSRWFETAKDRDLGPVEEFEMRGVGGIDTVRSFRADSLQVDGLLISTPEVLMTKDPGGIPFPDYIEGILGMDILKQYNLFLDYPQRRISFARRHTPDK